MTTGEDIAVDRSRVFEPAVGEYDDIVIEDITGALPEDLLGTLYRSAPVRWEAGGFYARHLFDGDGMVAKFSLQGGKLRYRNRYVRTPKYQREEAGRGDRVRGLGTLAAPSPPPPAVRSATPAAARPTDPTPRRSTTVTGWSRCPTTGARGSSTPIPWKRGGAAISAVR
ncbi:hypothetical protein GCM10009551_064590 [Nocardiopsis tropica]